MMMLLHPARRVQCKFNPTIPTNLQFSPMPLIPLMLLPNLLVTRSGTMDLPSPFTNDSRMAAVFVVLAFAQNPTVLPY